MTLSLRWKILLVTAGSAAGLVAVLLVAVRSAYETAAETRMEAAIGRLRHLLTMGIDDVRDQIDERARGFAGDVRVASLLEAAWRADADERAAVLEELPGLVRDQDAVRPLGGDRVSVFFAPPDAPIEAPPRCVYRVTRDRVAGRFGAVPIPPDGAPEDRYVAAYFADFWKAVTKDPDLEVDPGRFRPPLLLLATEDDVHVASRPWDVVIPGAGDLIGAVLLSRPLARTPAVAALGQAVGDPVFFGLLDRTVAESMVGAGAPESARAEFTAAGVRRRFEAVPIPVIGAADQLWGVIAFDLDRELAPLHEAEAAVWRASLAVLAGIVVVSLLLAAGIARPIRRLVAATDQIAAGNLEVTVTARSHDEIGQLAAHFNHMAEGLRERERVRGLLDKVVSQEVAGELMQLQRDGKLALGGEVREVSVLFCDLRGFTATTEAMTPQEVIAMLNEYLTAVVVPIDREGGVVDKFVGDEVMAIFGAPLRQADSAGRAVRAAHGMQAAMTELNRVREARGQQPLACGIGINTGPAVAGLTGSRDRLSYTVLGATVNLAARLCSAAKPGQVLVAQGTKADVDDIPLTPLQPITVKGFSQPVPIYAVGADVKDTRRLERTVDGGPPA